MKQEKSPNLSEVAISYKTKVKANDKPVIRTAVDAYEILKGIFSEETVEHHEEFVILLLNRANRVQGWAKISQGGITATITDQRIIFQYALLTNSTQVVLSHNHPSGQMIASEEDKRMTKRFVEAGKLLDIRILDHIIYTKDGYYSFAEDAEI